MRAASEMPGAGDWWQKHLRRGLVCAGMLLVVSGPAAADPYAGVEARLSASVLTFHPGKPIRIRFMLQNTTDAPVTLAVPDTKPLAPGSLTELPAAHVFSGAGFGGLIIRGDYDRVWKETTGYVPPAEAPEMVLGAHTLIGREMDITEYYPALRNPGVYRLVWQPYGGVIISNQLTIEVATLKQAEIITDDGVMTMQFFYDLAPNHVANFIELARNLFYDQKTFHRIEPGYFIQGGCPNGDGTGIRTDGKKLVAEFSDFAVDRGTVCMARVESDPDSASCQFLIANTRIASWDGRYTVFGHLVGEESLRTLDKLMNQEIDPNTGRPKRRAFIRSVRIVDLPVMEQMTPVHGRGFAETDPKASN